MESILATARTEGCPLEEALLASGTVLEEVIAIHMAMAVNVPYVDPRVYDTRLDNAVRIPEELARKHDIFPTLVHSLVVIPHGSEEHPERITALAERLAMEILNVDVRTSVALSKN